MAVTRPLPPWHPGPLAYIDNAFRALIKTKHAIRVYRFMQAEKRRLLEVESVVVHRFLDDYHEGDGDNDAAADEDEYFDCESSLDSNASLIDHLNDAAQRVWDVPSLRKEQSSCLERILFEDSCGGKVLNIAPTGSGKSLTLRMVGTFTGGVCVVFVPLLALTADQMHAIKSADQRYASFEAVHMDEIPSSSDALGGDIIPRLDGIGANSSSTLYCFTSPQYIVDNPSFLNALLRCHERRTLRFVAIDEAHLYAQHGKTFRESIRILKASFFEKVFAKEAAYHPLFMAMTTRTRSLVFSFETMSCSIEYRERRR